MRSAVSSTTFGPRSWMSHGGRVQVQRVATRHLRRRDARWSGCLKLAGSEGRLRRARSRSAGLRNDKQRRLSVARGSGPSRSSWRANSGLMGCSRCSSLTSRTSDGRYAKVVSVCLSGPRRSLLLTVSCSGGAGIRAAAGARRSSWVALLRGRVSIRTSGALLTGRRTRAHVRTCSRGLRSARRTAREEAENPPHDPSKSRQ